MGSRHFHRYEIARYSQVGTVAVVALLFEAQDLSRISGICIANR